MTTRICLLLALASLVPCVGAVAAAADLMLPEAATSLERQFQESGEKKTARQKFRYPVAGSDLVLEGEAELQPLRPGHCRQSLELAYRQPFERKGVRITSVSRRSVLEGACQRIGDTLATQARASAARIVAQVRRKAGAGNPEASPDATVDETAPSSVAKPANRSTAAEAGWQTLRVRERAVIRATPARDGRKRGSVDRGAHLRGQAVDKPRGWFRLEAGRGYISAAVVEAKAERGEHPAPAKKEAASKQGVSKQTGTKSRSDALRIKVTAHAVLRDRPSFKGAKVANLREGTTRLARPVPGKPGWYELLDGKGRRPLYIHESVISTRRK